MVSEPFSREAWEVVIHDAFAAELLELPQPVRRELLAMARLLSRAGPALRRPHADTLVGSRHANMKELRFAADGGIWRVAYAFDRERRGIVLVAGNKAGQSQKRFYKTLISRADERFDAHLATVRRR